MVVVHRPGWRAGPAVSRKAVVGAALHRTGGQQPGTGCAGAGGQRVHVRGNVPDYPVPPAAAGRRIGIMDHQGIALRARRGIAPLQGRRHVAAGAAHAVEDLGRRDPATLGEVRTGQAEFAAVSVCHGGHQQQREQEFAHDACFSSQVAWPEEDTTFTSGMWNSDFQSRAISRSISSEALPAFLRSISASSVISAWSTPGPNR